MLYSHPQNIEEEISFMNLPNQSPDHLDSKPQFPSGIPETFDSGAEGNIGFLIYPGTNNNHFPAIDHRSTLGKSGLYRDCRRSISIASQDEIPAVKLEGTKAPHPFRGCEEGNPEMDVKHKDVDGGWAYAVLVAAFFTFAIVTGKRKLGSI